MATHISTNPFNSSTVPLSQPVKLAATSKKSRRERCGSPPSNWRESRRFVSILYAVAGSGFDKYVKMGCYPMEVALITHKYDKLTKKLDPLEAYGSPGILTQLQIKDFEKSLEGDQPQFATCRSRLRSGLAASLHVYIRAVAQYASDDDGNGKTASSDVDQCLRALEELDSLLLHATRNERAPVSSMKAQINTALNALDSASKGKMAADSYRNSLENADLDISDPDLKQLESKL
ncbi:hypothetical protein D8674_032602 [Pyrus ussuriensis x Pyrus communis]|uniref:DUF7880 domain-containing protein n=1 Tax=Pyrus ussuriensis x Pyrus communis TaxID=2448454 RepID=A0A5N5HLW4_9ROSA|nr:hypothetical protein D8674_032602 [Pyrus ussuriensis x Pyrus communis]